MDSDPIDAYAGLTTCPVCGCLDRKGIYRCHECGTFHAGSIMEEREPPVAVVVEEGLEEELLEQLLSAVDGRAARVVAVGELDLVDEPHGVQEAHADAAAAVLLAHVLRHVREREVHRVGAEEHLVGGHRALLEYLAHLIEEVLLQLQVLEDRLDHHLARGAGGGTAGFSQLS